MRIEITSAEIWQSPEPSDLMTWEICRYLRPEHTCVGCPHSEPYEHGETITWICRALAEEACRMVMAVQRREHPATERADG